MAGTVAVVVDFSTTRTVAVDIDVWTSVASVVVTIEVAVLPTCQKEKLLGWRSYKHAYVTGVVVATTDVTTGIDKKLEQNAVAADLLARSVGFVPVGSKHRTKLFLARSSSNGEANAGKLKASTRVPYRKNEAIVGCFWGVAKDTLVLILRMKNNIRPGCYTHTLYTPVTSEAGQLAVQGIPSFNKLERLC
jgi:hypothetical protein